jgi:hypothetical protein
MVTPAMIAIQAAKNSDPALKRNESVVMSVPSSGAKARVHSPAFDRSAGRAAPPETRTS